MKTFFAVAAGILMVAFMNRKEPKNETIYFTSLNYAIQQGQFDGVARVKDLRSHGDFGLGSEEKLAGELVVLNGEFYSIDSHGKARVMNDNNLIAFAAIKTFNADNQSQAEAINSLNDLEQQLSDLINPNAFAAIKIHGTFSSISLRSFDIQQKPYKPVDDVPEIKFDRKDIRGTLVGYFTPQSAQVMNSPTFHFHFIDDHKTTGGHVLDCSVNEGVIEIDYVKEVHIQLPDTTTTEHVNLDEPIKQKG